MLTYIAVSVLVQGSTGAQISVSRFSTEQVTAAKHDWALTPNPGGVWVAIDTCHMGVGGDTSWSPETHAQYRISPKENSEWKFKVRIRPSVPSRK